MPVVLDPTSADDGFVVGVLPVPVDPVPVIVPPTEPLVAGLVAGVVGVVPLVPAPPVVPTPGLDAGLVAPVRVGVLGDVLVPPVPTRPPLTMLWLDMGAAPGVR